MIVNNPITFLCGPFYSKNDNGDRRNILLDFFDEKFNRRIIPLIIDDFVISDNIKDDTINVQLLEEIFASISSKTYIFLDTISAASELGLFANHSNTNKIHVLLPNRTDILENRVGYFVSDIMLRQNGHRINIDYYRPKIVKKAIATNYVIEHYGFINNTLPNEIADKIINDDELKVVKKEFAISNIYDIPDDFAEINILSQNDNLDVGVSVKTLFYIIVQLVYNKYKKSELKDKTLNKMPPEFIDEIFIKLRKIIALSISINSFQKLYDYGNINIKTILNKDIIILLKHLLKFIFLYHESEPRNGKMLISGTDKILTPRDSDMRQNPYEFFDLSPETVNLIIDIGSNDNRYFEEFKIKKNQKTRTLCKYKNSEDGNKARELHNKLFMIIKSKISLSHNSYAYQDGKSIVSCVNQHKNSNYFMKFDIKNFFNSIDLDFLIDDTIETFEVDNLFRRHMETLIKSCTYDNKLPLGFTISPILTEIYMKKFDENILVLLNEMDLIYTRYADDIMISSSNLINEELQYKIYHIVEQTLIERKLKINKTKFKFISISEVGHHVKYLGINIVKGIEDNYLSVGKNYKNMVAKEYLQYLELPSETDEHKMIRYYVSKKIAGKLSFVQQVEGQSGYKKIIERIKASTKGRLNISTDKIMFEKEQNIA